MAITVMLLAFFLICLCIGGMVPLIILLAMRKIAKKALAIIGIVLLGVAALILFCLVCAGFLTLLI